MNISRLDLLTLLIGLFSFSACQKPGPNSVGLMVNSRNAVSSFFTNTIAISTTTVLDNDPILTNSLKKYPAGVLNDPLFGATTSTILMSLTLPNSGLTFGTAPNLKSAYLVLNYANEYYGDPNANFTFEVYQLADRLIASSNLYNTNDVAPTGSSIGTTMSNINLSSSNVPTENTPPQIRIPINETFINSYFLKADLANFVNSNAFGDFIKGLYLKVTPTAAGTGGIVFFDLNTGGSRLELSYDNAADATVKSVNFPIQASAANPVIAAFNHNFSGGGATEVKNALSSTTSDYTFVQPMAGVRTQVNFPDLSPLTKLGNITINKAELVVSTYPRPTDNATIFTPAPRLYLYRTDIAGQRQFVPDCNIADPRTFSDTNFGGFYTNDGKYRFIITSYLQDLVNGKLKQYNTYISVADPDASRTSALFSSATTAKRAVIGGGTNSASPYQMKLNITYSKTN